MRNGLIILGIFAIVFSCKAQQQVFPLNTSAYKISSNAYFKDLNNELNYYTGTWKAVFQDKTIVLQISEQIKAQIELFDKNFYRDQLFIRYEITKNGIISESTLNKDFTNDVGLSIKSAYTQDNGNSVTLLFSGGNCSVGIGTITLKKINATQFYGDIILGQQRELILFALLTESTRYTCLRQKISSLPNSNEKWFNHIRNICRCVFL